MTIERYFRWMRVFECFTAMDRTEQLVAVHGLLNDLWLEERKRAAPEELQNHAAAWAVELELRKKEH